MLTAVTEMFGVHGDIGDMVIHPKLVKDQFDSKGNAKLQLQFAGKDFQVIFINPQKLTYGEYVIKKAVCDGRTELDIHRESAYLCRADILSMPDSSHVITVELGCRSK